MRRNIIVVVVVGVLMAGFVIFARARTADLLATITGSPVLVVPALGQAPASMLATVYVFTNGVAGDGPLEFQPDVFDAPPGTPAYTPLRSITLLTWTNEGAARELRSAAEVEAAITRGELKVERPGVVVNMPLLTWPGGSR